MARVYPEAERKELMIRFLKAYAKCGVITQACGKAVVDPSTVRRWIKTYPKFAAKVEEMREKFVDGLESVAIERARDKSDALLALLLKANRPDKYKENHKIDGNLSTQPIQLVFSKDEWGDMPNYVGGGDKDAENDEHSGD